MPKRKNRYTVSEAARKLGVTRGAIYAAIKRKQLATVWTTVKVRMIPAASLEAYNPDPDQQARGKKN